MKAKVVMLPRDSWFDRREFPDDLKVGDRVDWSISAGGVSCPIRTYVTRIDPLPVPEDGMTHEVYVSHVPPPEYYEGKPAKRGSLRELLEKKQKDSKES